LLLLLTRVFVVIVAYFLVDIVCRRQRLSCPVLGLTLETQTV